MSKDTFIRTSAGVRNRLETISTGSTTPEDIVRYMFSRGYRKEFILQAFPELSRSQIESIRSRKYTNKTIDDMYSYNSVRIFNLRGGVGQLMKSHPKAHRPDVESERKKFMLLLERQSK